VKPTEILRLASLGGLARTGRIDAKAFDTEYGEAAVNLISAAASALDLVKYLESDHPEALLDPRIAKYVASIKAHVVPR
jgi:hypothetical protein